LASSKNPSTQKFLKKYDSYPYWKDKTIRVTLRKYLKDNNYDLNAKNRLKYIIERTMDNNDGFEKRKKFGRYDINNTWDKIENEWFWNYKNKYVKPEYSINKKVKYDDEWCAESFLETDYNAITENEFENMLKKYAAFKILN
jgi:hypothetical protein